MPEIGVIPPLPALQSQEPEPHFHTQSERSPHFGAFFVTIKLLVGYFSYV